MKKTLFAMLLASTCALSAKSQTKGTNAVGFGLSVEKYKDTYTSSSQSSTNEQKVNNYSLTYGYFIKDNARISLTGFYGRQRNGSSETSENKYDGYGASVNYQKYYPLFKKFYAYAGGGFGYFYNKNSYSSSNYLQSSKINNYNASATGGVAFFASKHVSLEAQLLSASAGYSKTSNDENSGNTTNRNFSRHSFNLSTSGKLTDLGFNIYFLF